MFLVAVALYSRFSIDDWLRRDESIYTYGGQQLAEGVPVYKGIFDPKTPLSSMLIGAGVAIARAVGTDELHLVRIEFFLFACLTVAAVYVLALWLWDSVLAGIVAAVTFAAFRGFAIDALGGPDAKTPGMFFAVLSMALLVRRRWFWGAFAGSLAFLVWQPLGVYVPVAVLGVLVTAAPGERWRRLGGALAGAVIPLAAVTLYFLIAGALPQFIETAVTFPLTGVQRGHETLHEHFDVIADTVAGDYGKTQVLFWAGLVALFGLVVPRWRGRDGGALRRAIADPYVFVVITSFVLLLLFSLRDFQGYPDLYPLLPYSALGVGGVAAVLVGLLARRSLGRVAAVGALVASAVLVGLTWHWYSIPESRDTALVRQRGDAAAIERMLNPGETLYALGDPTILVLTKRRNPSRFIYLGSGVSEWVVKHTPGGMAGWEARIRASDPAVVVIAGWEGPRKDQIERMLRRTYEAGYVGKVPVLVKPAVSARAARRGVTISATPRARL
jgi:4-amino-4-deoxy-L-arabinose transferase-like glycosyltransferase